MQEGSEIKKFDPLATRIAKAIAPMTAITVTDKESKDLAMLALQTVKGYRKEVDAVRTSLVKPYNDLVKKANARAGEVDAPLEKVESYLNKVLATYAFEVRQAQALEQQKLDQERRENERRTQQRLADAAAVAPDAESRAEIENQAIHDAKKEQARIEMAKEDLKEEGVSNVRHNYQFEVVKAEEVKLDFQIPDLKAIGKIVKTMGPRAEKFIGGIRVWDEPIVASGSITPPSAKNRRIS